MKKRADRTPKTGRLIHDNGSSPVLMMVNDPSIGGAQTFINGLVAHWNSERRIHLVVLRERDALSKEFEEHFESVSYLNMTSNPVSILRAFAQFRALVNALKPSIVHSHLLHADFLNLTMTPKGVGRITTIHTSGMTSSDPLLSRFLARGIGVLSRRFSAIIACNASCVRFARRHGYKGEITVIENGVSLPAERQVDPSSTQFLSAARLHPMKGHSVLLTAFVDFVRDFPEWTLVCLGESVSLENDAFAALAANAGAREMLLDGRIMALGSTHNLSDFLAESSALVISSTYGEASPMVGIEATSFGVPVVATDVGGAADFAFDERFIAAPGSAEGLAESLRQFASMSAGERQRISGWSRTVAETRFAMSSRISSYSAVYVDVLAKIDAAGD